MSSTGAIDTLRTVLDATRETVRNPEDTSNVFRIAEALSLGAPERMARKMRRSAPELLDAKPEILRHLNDRAWLERQAEGSLADAYLRFIDSEGITADGLVEASLEGANVLELPSVTDTDWLKRRMRDSHDLWHAVTGYHGDLLGETALLAFTFAQSRHPGVGFLAGIGWFLSTVPIGRRDLVVDGKPIVRNWSERRKARGFISDGFRRGRRARWLVAAPWERLLEQPLATVRDMFGISPVPDYKQIRPASAAAS